MPASFEYASKHLLRTARSFGPIPGSSSRRPLGQLLWLLIFILAGCATAPQSASDRPFQFGRDTFAFPNELYWQYEYDQNGKWTTRPNDPKPTYAHHCFVVARAAAQFFYHARFQPDQPVASENTYRDLVRRVTSLSPRHRLEDSKKILIPGYADLYGFSQAQESLLKSECGGSWESYFQKGHWRMIFPFSRDLQARAANQLQATVRTNELAVVHVVRFPQLSINHAMVVYEARETPEEIQFVAYDPNVPETPVLITYHREKRTFSLAPNHYFYGGRVDVYQVYHRWNY